MFFDRFLFMAKNRAGFCELPKALFCLCVAIGSSTIGRAEPSDAGATTAAPAAPQAATPANVPPDPPLAAPEPPPLPPPPVPIERVKALFQAAGVPYPPRSVVFAAFKDERELELYARAKKGEWRFVHRFPILGASGSAGPKLQEGDRQVPEGVYAVESLHPKSKFHLALRLGYPNAFDKKMGRADKRTKLGGDIMIHGSFGSTGCLAMGNPGIEELYALAEAIKIRNVKVVIAPFDLRVKPQTPLPQKPDWVETLYEQVAGELAHLPVSPKEPVPEPPPVPPEAVKTATASSAAARARDVSRPALRRTAARKRIASRPIRAGRTRRSRRRG